MQQVVFDAIRLASTHRDFLETLPKLIPMFAGIIATTHRQLLAHLLEREADWPWHEPPHNKPPTASTTFKE